MKQTDTIRLYLFLYGLLLLFLFAVATAAFGSESESGEVDPQDIELLKLLQVEELEIPVLSGDIVMDGILDEPFWNQAAAYEIKLETYPALLKPSPVKTDVRIARTESHLMVGFIAYDPEPEKSRHR